MIDFSKEQNLAANSLDNEGSASLYSGPITSCPAAGISYRDRHLYVWEGSRAHVQIHFHTSLPPPSPPPGPCSAGTRCQSEKCTALARGSAENYF